MAPTQGLCTSFKLELLKAVHNFTTSTGNSFKLALVTSTSTISPSTANYAAISNEHGATGGYTTTGTTLTIPASCPSTSGTTAITDFDDALWTTATITARGALLYNDTASGDPAVLVLDFGADKTSTAGDFRVIFPTYDVSNAIVRIA